MDTTDQAVFVLKIIFTVGPIALYFLGLGLVNSQARPCMVSARADFTLLGVVFVPAIAAPVLVLIEHGQFHLVSGVVVGVLTLFFCLLPRRGRSWVVYNCSPAQCRRMLQQACRQLGWRLDRTQGEPVRVPEAGLILTQTTLPWLRSVTLQIEGEDTGGPCGARARLVSALRSEMSRESFLPSATGASLVIIGAGLLGLPMWYLFHHIDAIVDMVMKTFFA